MVSKPQETAERPTSGTAKKFHAYLDTYPEARNILQQRLKDNPDYEAWLQQFGKGVLSGLDPETS